MEAKVKRGRGRPRKDPNAAPKIVKEKKTTGREPMSDEHKRKLIEGRARARAEKALKASESAEINVKEKPIIILTGKEEDAFDFFPLIRKAFRSRGDYIISPKIINRIVSKEVWNDVKAIKVILQEYVVLKRRKSDL